MMSPVANIKTPNGTLVNKGLRVWHFKGDWTPEDVRSLDDTFVWVFQDNSAGRGISGTACIRHEGNVLGLVTRHDDTGQISDYFGCHEFKRNKKLLMKGFGSIFKAWKSGKDIVLDRRGYGGGVGKMKEMSVMTYLWLFVKMRDMQAFMRGDAVAKEREAVEKVTEAEVIQVISETNAEIERLRVEGQRSTDEPAFQLKRVSRRALRNSESQNSLFGEAEGSAPSAITGG